MTVDAEPSFIGPTQGDGATTTYAFPYKLLDQSHLVVTLLVCDEDGGVDEEEDPIPQILNTHYTLSGTGPPYNDGVEIEFLTAPSNLRKVSAKRTTPLSQPTPVGAQVQIPSASLENMHDRAVLLIQEIYDRLNELSGGALSLDLIQSLVNQALAAQAAAEAAAAAAALSALEAAGAAGFAEAAEDSATAAAVSEANAAASEADAEEAAGSVSSTFHNYGVIPPPFVKGDIWIFGEGDGTNDAEGRLRPNEFNEFYLVPVSSGDDGDVLTIDATNTIHGVSWKAPVGTLPFVTFETDGLNNPLVMQSYGIDSVVRTANPGQFIVTLTDDLQTLQEPLFVQILNTQGEFGSISTGVIGAQQTALDTIMITLGQYVTPSGGAGSTLDLELITDSDGLQIVCGVLRN